jgi:hypothetical protein
MVRPIKKDELEWMWKEQATVYLKVIAWDST